MFVAKKIILSLSMAIAIYTQTSYFISSNGKYRRYCWKSHKE